MLFSIALLSLAGIPATAGFIGKFYIFTAGVQGATWGLLWLLVIGSGIAIYYYLRIIFAMTGAAEAGTGGGLAESIPTPARLFHVPQCVQYMPEPKKGMICHHWQCLLATR